MQIATGEFNVGTGTTGVPQTLPFDPTLTGCGLVLSWSGQTSNTVARATIQAGYGIAGYSGGANGNASVAGTSKDTGTSACQQGERDDSVIHALSTAGADAGKAGITWSSTGFTITPSTAFTNNILVKWLAIPMAALATVTAAEPATATTSQTTGLPRAPRCGIVPVMGGVSAFSSPSQVATDFNLSFGVFLKNPAGTIRNGVMAGWSDDGRATTVSEVYFRSAECMARGNSTGGTTPLARASCTAMGSADFTWTYSAVEGAGTHQYPVLLFFDGLWELSTITCATNTTTDMVITPGFKVLGGIVAMSGNTTESSAGTATGSARLCTGFFTGVGIEHSTATRDTNAQVGAVCTSAADNASSIYVPGNGAIGVVGHLTAIGPTTATWRMTTAVSAFVGWVVCIGDYPSVESNPVQPAPFRRRADERPGDPLPGFGSAALTAAPENFPALAPRLVSLRQLHGGEALAALAAPALGTWPGEVQQPRPQQASARRPSGGDAIPAPPAAALVAWPGDAQQQGPRSTIASRPAGGDAMPSVVAAGLAPWASDTTAPGPRQLVQLRFAGGDAPGGLVTKPWPGDQPPPPMRRIATIRHAGGEPIGFLALGWAGDSRGPTVPRPRPPETAQGLPLPGLIPIKKTLGSFDAPGTPWRPRKAWREYLSAVPLPDALAAIATLNAPLFAVFDDFELMVDFDDAELTVVFDDVTLTADFDE